MLVLTIEKVPKSYAKNLMMNSDGKTAFLAFPADIGI
jgi:hypothetical protein